MIVGGGDAAMENALLLSEFATEVLVAFRRNEPTARSEFVESARGRNNIRLLSDTVVTTISGNAKIESAELKNIRDDHTSREAVDAVLIRIGVEPNSELLRGKAALDERGYVVVNRSEETDLPGIFAVGDVAHPVAPTLNTAAGTGASAAKSAFEFIEKLRTRSSQETITVQ
jgi:thioredoxin reductase (NADPH)